MKNKLIAMREFVRDHIIWCDLVDLFHGLNLRQYCYLGLICIACFAAGVGYSS